MDFDDTKSVVFMRDCFRPSINHWSDANQSLPYNVFYFIKYGVLLLVDCRSGWDLSK